MPFSSSVLRRPAPLSKQGHVAVLAISSPSTVERIELAKQNLEAFGLQVTLAENLFQKRRTYLAGEDDFRLEEINRFLRDPSFDAFFFSRGGYGAMRILDGIDYAAIEENPRPIVGYSDLTALHQAVARHSGVATFHGPMLNTDFFEALSPPIEDWFWSLLGGRSPNTYSFDSSQVVSAGYGEGILFGGCLSLTSALVGTPYDFWVDDGIWFWEDVSEPTYRIDRMLTHLKLSGRFEKIRGIMIGKLKECGGDRLSELSELLTEFFGELGIPVVSELPFGHHGDNLLMPIGVPVRLDSSSGTLTFPEPVVDASL